MQLLFPAPYHHAVLRWPQAQHLMHQSVTKMAYQNQSMQGLGQNRDNVSGSEKHFDVGQTMKI